MTDNIFNKNFYYIEGEHIELRLIDTYDSEDGELPFYWWDIILKQNHIAIGKISFRIGHNYHSYYNGNIGYEIDEEYRGHHYALPACQLVLRVAQYHKMDRIYLSCDYDNVASSPKLDSNRIPHGCLSMGTVIAYSCLCGLFRDSAGLCAYIRRS